MLTPFQQQLISAGLLGVALYFGVQLVRGGAGYLRYRRIAPTALLSWPTPPPARLPLLTGLGLVGATLAPLNAWQQNPPHHAIAFALMALYFLGLVPLARRIRFGLYQGGVWGHRGFIAWGDIARTAFDEGPPIVLLLNPRRGGRPYKLPVPPAEYGTVRKILDEKSRTGALHPEPAILGI